MIISFHGATVGWFRGCGPFSISAQRLGILRGACNALIEAHNGNLLMPKWGLPAFIADVPHEVHSLTWPVLVTQWCLMRFRYFKLVGTCPRLRDESQEPFLYNSRAKKQQPISKIYCSQD